MKQTNKDTNKDKNKTNKMHRKIKPIIQTELPTFFFAQKAAKARISTFKSPFILCHF